MAEIMHIVFGEAGGIELRDALRQSGHDDRVLEFPDDFSFGPIAPSDPARRAQWVADQLGASEWHEIAPHIDAFWAEALSSDARRVVWFSRRTTQDYCGFLNYLGRVGHRPCDVVDLTEAMVPVAAVMERSPERGAPFTRTLPNHTNSSTAICFRVPCR